MEGRRGFLTTHLPVGFALAVRALAAITTDTKGLTAGEVLIPTKDGRQMPAYRAVPSRGKNYPVVLVVGERMGDHKYIQDVCRRLGKYGYMAIAPDHGRQVPDEQVMADLDAALEWAGQRGDGGKAAVTGFGWGGRIAWLYAAHQPKLRVAAAWYGVLPVDIAASLRVPVLGLYGEKDNEIPLDTVEKMRAALRAGRSGSKIVVYAGAPQGFHADYRESYRKAAAEDAWERMLVWFKKYDVA